MRVADFAAGTLRTKFLLSLAVISALLTAGVLLVVRYRVELQVREDIAHTLRTAVVTFAQLQRQREATLQRSAALIATLPTLKAVMSSGDAATIQDASQPFWELAGSQVFILVDRDARTVALHASTPRLTADVVQASVRRYLDQAMSTDWWFVDGRLFQVFFQPIYVGGEDTGHAIGILVLGYEIGAGDAADLQRITASDVAFGYQRALVVSTLDASHRVAMAAALPGLSGGDPSGVRELRLGGERYVATSVPLSMAGAPLVTLTVLTSFDQATAFLRSLNRWIIAIGAAAVIVGGVLVFLVSTTFTRPLARLVSGVRALESGDFHYPLDLDGGDEVSKLTRAFATMRQRLQETQRRLLDAEQLATIGRMSSTISHDLRHPLTAIQAYAEFLADGDLDPAQRQDCYNEIRIAVNRMTDEINSLLAFSKEGGALRVAEHDAVDVIERSIRTMKALPEFDAITVTCDHNGACVGLFDPAKLERVMLNLLFNAGEALAPGPGRIDVSCRGAAGGLEIRVADTGPGIASAIAANLFQPFVSHGKEKGIGLGLTVVQSIVQQHGGTIAVERTGPDGTVFLVTLPQNAAPVGGAEPATAGT